MTACQKRGFDTNQMLRETGRIVLILMTDGQYGAVNSQVHRMPEATEEALKKKRGHPPQNKNVEAETMAPKRSPGA